MFLVIFAVRGIFRHIKVDGDKVNGEATAGVKTGAPAIGELLTGVYIGVRDIHFECR